MQFAGSPRKIPIVRLPLGHGRQVVSICVWDLGLLSRFFMTCRARGLPAVDYASRGLRPHGLLRPEG